MQPRPCFFASVSSSSAAAVVDGRNMFIPYAIASSHVSSQAEHYQKQARKRQCCLLFLVLGIIVALVLAGVFIFKK
jgi:uncharacterized membrane protein